MRPGQTPAPDQATAAVTVVQPPSLRLQALSRLPEGQDRVALIRALTAEHGRLATLMGSDAELALKLQEVADFKDRISKEIDSLPLQEGIRRVIEWLTVLENTSSGIDLLRELSKEDLADFCIPAILFGLLLFKSKTGLSDRARLEILGRIGAEMSDKEIIKLLENCSKIDDAPLQGDYIATVVARELLNVALIDNPDIRFAVQERAQGDPYEEETGGEDLYRGTISSVVDEIFTEMSEPTAKILDAIREYDEKLFADIISELRRRGTRIRKGGKRYRPSEPVTLHLRNTTQFEEMLRAFVSKPRKIRMGMKRALRQTNASVEPSAKALLPETAGAPPTEIAADPESPTEDRYAYEGPEPAADAVAAETAPAAPVDYGNELVAIKATLSDLDRKTADIIETRGVLDSREQEIRDAKASLEERRNMIQELLRLQSAREQTESAVADLLRQLSAQS